MSSKHIDVFVNKNFNQSTFKSPRTVAPVGYDVVLSKSLKEQVLVWLTAREQCLNACQQWVVVALLNQMGYNIQMSYAEEEQRSKPSELTKTLKKIKSQINDSNYCDFEEGISDECLRVFEGIRNRGQTTDPETATRLANQMKCLTSGFAAGLNPQEINHLPKKIDAIRELVDKKMIENNEDDNQVILNYLTTFGEQIKFRKQITKVTALGIEPSAKSFEDALKRDVQDRSTMGVNNKSISVVDVNKQLLAVRTAAAIDLKTLPVGQEINMNQHFEAIINDLKANKERYPLQIIEQSLSTLGYVAKVY